MNRKPLKNISASIRQRLFNKANFPRIERYISTRLGINIADVEPGSLAVVETPLRMKREESFSYIRALWLLQLVDGRSIVSVPPGAGNAVRAVLDGVDLRHDMHDEHLISKLSKCVDAAMVDAGLSRTDRFYADLLFACNRDTLVTHTCGDCRKLTDSSILVIDGLRLPEHCLPDGIVYGVIEDSHVVSVAYAHRTGLMEDQVVDLGVETAQAYRGKGYAKTAVSAVVNQVAQTGGEGCYYCSPDNQASIATAQSVGFQLYGSSLILAAPLSRD